MKQELEKIYSKIGRDEAFSCGQKYYWGGPCRQGHQWRYTCNCACVICENRNSVSRKFKKRNPGLQGDYRRANEERRDMQEMDMIEKGYEEWWL